MSDIADRVKSIVVEHLGVEGDKVIEGASFIDDLGADSLIQLNWLWLLKKNSDVRYLTTQLKRF